MNSKYIGYKIVMYRPPKSYNFVKNVLKLDSRVNKDYKSTIGTSIWSKELTLKGSITINLIIWDLAGSSQFKRVRQSYLSNADGAIFIVNLWEKQSFEAVSKIYAEIEKTVRKLPFILIGRESSSRSTVRSIREKIVEFCNRKHGKYVEVSPEVYTEIQAAFQGFSTEVYENFEEKIEEEKEHQQSVLNQVQRILSVSNKISFERMQKMLDIEIEEFDKNLLNWAEEFGFVIEGEDFVVNQDSTAKFINYLEQEFEKWEISQREKFDKI